MDAWCAMRTTSVQQPSFKAKSPREVNLAILPYCGIPRTAEISTAEFNNESLSPSFGNTHRHVLQQSKKIVKVYTDRTLVEK